MTFRANLTRSLAIEGLKPLAVKVRQIDERYFELHQRCAAGTITEAECDELDRMIAAKQGGQDHPANDQ